MGEIIITSSVLIIALLILRKLCWGKISRRLQYGLWLLVAIRLLVPAQLLTSPVSMMQLVEEVRTVQQEQTRQAAGEAAVQEENLRPEEGKMAQSEQDVTVTIGEMVAADTGMEVAENDSAGEISTDRLNRPMEQTAEASKWKKLGTIVWYFYCLGVVGMAGVLLFCNLHFRRRLRAGSVLLGQEGHLKIYLADGLDVPCMCGVLRPAIYLNQAGLLTEERKRHILSHEITHYRHGDHIWALVRSICLVVYWFHPLVWVAAVISARDGEMACDEGTLERLGEDSRQAYGQTLIEMATQKERRSGLFYCATGMINRKKELKQRVMAIAAGRKRLLRTTLFVSVAALLLAACTAGQKVEEIASPAEEIASAEQLQSSEEADSTKGETQEQPEAQEEFPVREDGSYRLSEYTVDLDGDKKAERIVFDVFYYADLEQMAEAVTEELLWQELWQGCEVMARVLSGEGAEEKILWERSYSEAHAGNGNMAVVSENGQKYLLQYANLMYQGAGGLEYQLLQFTAGSDAPVRVKENSAGYGDGYAVVTTEDDIAKVLEVEAELNEYLSAHDTDILLNASVSGRENCYLYGSEEGLLNGVRRQTAFDVFMTEVGGNGWELNLKDYFYPQGTESLTELPVDAEARIRAGEVLCMEVSPENATAGRLDLDGDGTREVLYLYAVGEWYGDDGWQGDVIERNYRIRVNDFYFETYCSILDPVLMAWSPDGKEILLAVYDDGPSNDPLTSFYRYDQSGVYPAGNITDDLRSVEMDADGVIRGHFRADMIQTEWAYAYYEWNGSKIEKRADEIYYMLDDSGWREANDTPLLLLQELTVYEERSEESRALTMKPQAVTNVATDAKEWVLLKAEDGTEGWLKVVDGKIPSLGNLRTSEVLEGLNMAD